MEIVALRPVAITHENFKVFGQLAEPGDDGAVFGEQDVQLNLSNGTPRFYIMKLHRTGLKFKAITHHAKVTQCLGSCGAHPWYMAVAPPSIVDSHTKGALRSKSGHFYLPPSLPDIKVFRIDGPVFIKLHQGTWHAGPLFEHRDSIDFYNLELSDTNVVDHTTHGFGRELTISE